MILQKNLSKTKRASTDYHVEFKEVISKKSLEGIKGILNAKNIGGNKWLLSSSSKIDLREDIFKFAVKNNYNVLSLSVDEQKMEDIFQNLTN